MTVINPDLSPGDQGSQGLTRRALLRNTTAIALGATLFGPLVYAADGTPQRGGIFRTSLSGDPPNFDIISNTSSQVLDIVAACYNSLVRFDPADPSQIVGDLAESWSLSDDGLVYEFKLVSGVQFSDGKPLTSADVKFTFDLIRNPAPDVSSPRKVLLSAIEGIETPDDTTVVMRLSEPSPVLLATLASPWFVVGPKHVLEAKGHMRDEVLGSGPFVLANYTRGVVIQLARNPNYHVPDRPYLDGIDLYIIPNPATTFSYMRTGQLDQMGISGSETREVASGLSDVMTVLSNTSYTADLFAINVRRSPMDDIRVRQAINLAVSREESIAIVAEGDGVVGGLMPPEPWGLKAEELADVMGYGPDIGARREQAKRLLAEAGHPDGFSTTITTRRGTSTHDQRGIFLKDQLARIGIAATIDGQESASYFEKIQKFDFDIATISGSVPVNDPNFYLGDYHTSGGGQNFTGLSDPVIDDLYAQQARELDAAKRREIARKLELAALESSATMNLYFKTKYVVTSNRVRGFVLHPEPDNSLRRDTLWLAE